MTLEQLKEYNRRLSALLEDPQPGLISWNMFLHDVMTQMCNEFMGQDHSPPKWLGGSQRVCDRTYGLYFWDTKGKWLGPWQGILPLEIKTKK